MAHRGLNNTRPARDDGYQGIQYLRKDYTFADRGLVLTVGTVPAGAVIIRPLSGVDVQVASTDATNKQMDIGNSTTADLYGTDLSTATIAFVPLDEVVTLKMAVDTTILATPDFTGTAGVGSGSIIIAYIAQEG